VTDERRILFVPLPTAACKNRGQLETDRTEETNCVAPNAFSRKATNCKRLASNTLRQQENREQKQKSKIPERETNSDKHRSKMKYQNGNQLSTLNRVWPTADSRQPPCPLTPAPSILKK
jgi:hypothetical protein